MGARKSADAESAPNFSEALRVASEVFDFGQGLDALGAFRESSGEVHVWMDLTDPKQLHEVAKRMGWSVFEFPDGLRGPAVKTSGLVGSVLVWLTCPVGEPAMHPCGCPRDVVVSGGARVQCSRCGEWWE